MIPGSGRSPGEGKGYPLQYSGLANSMYCIVHVRYVVLKICGLTVLTLSTVVIHVFNIFFFSSLKRQ